ncbi:uncharacterized protein [Palaemon carinicauda]|uniref:uncharacterized protein n=1 Tax=Palaemon carinicauda TaxID=392227 RepID=UPI0035B5CB0B
MSYLERPYDKGTAIETMKKFSGLAYSLVNKKVFQKAVEILYGPEFVVSVDLSKRMQFSCKICNRDMNNEIAMKEHKNSGAHQRNLDKKVRDSGFSNISARNYAKDSIHYRLLNSHIAPVGLQMIEEYINHKGNMYYICKMCAAHGKMETMYHHIIGKKHTERYIRSGCKLENSILNPNEREALRSSLIKDEGINVDAIRTIKGDLYYPYKWEREATALARFNRTIKREPLESNGGARPKFKMERRSSSSSPTPGSSRGRSRSISPSRKYYKKSPSWSREVSHSPSSRLHSPSPSRRRQSRSPSRRLYSPSFSRGRQSRSPSRRQYSPYSSRRRQSQSPSRRLHSPPSSRGCQSQSPSRQCRMPWSRSSSSSSTSEILEGPSVRVRNLKDLSAYRNRSPSPPVQIKQEPVSQIKEEPVSRINAEPVFHIKEEPISPIMQDPSSPPPRVKEEPLSPTASPDDIHSIRMAVPITAIKKEMCDATVQTKLNLEMMMMHLNDYNKTCADTPFSTPEECKLAIDTMNCYANALRGVMVRSLEDGTAKSPDEIRRLQFLKEKMEKVVGYATKRYLPTWKNELENFGR